MLSELTELTMLDEGDPQSFRVRAYESARHAIAAQATDLGKLTVKELQKIEGIGKSTADKIRELIETGKVAKLEGLRQKHPAGVVALMRIPGLGPKNVNRLRADLGVASIDDLRAALAAHKLRDLKGFGEKSEEKLGRALQRMEELGAIDRTPISVALPLANEGGRSARWRCRGSPRPPIAGRCAASPRRSATSTSWWRPPPPSR